MRPGRRASKGTRSSRAKARAAQRNTAITASAKSRPRSSQRNANNGLTEHEIVERTLWLIRTHGMESLSMRKLAGELGVAPMSLYHYVKNKDELLERVVDTLLARVPTPAPHKHGWRKQLRTYAMTLIEQLAWHRGIARLVIERPPTLEGQRHLRYTGAVLTGAGFDARAAVQHMATFHTFLYGVLAAQAHLPALMAVVSKKYDAPSGFSRNASTRSPQINMNEQLRNLGLHAWYEAGIDSILSAIALQLRASSPTKARGEA